MDCLALHAQRSREFSLATAGAARVSVGSGSFGEAESIEQTVRGEMAGVKVRGIVELLDVDGCVIDFKTA